MAERHAPHKNRLTVFFRLCPFVSFFTVAFHSLATAAIGAGRNKLDETTQTDRNGRER